MKKNNGRTEPIIGEYSFMLVLPIDVRRALDIRRGEYVKYSITEDNKLIVEKE